MNEVTNNFLSRKERYVSPESTVRTVVPLTLIMASGDSSTENYTNGGEY